MLRRAVLAALGLSLLAAPSLAGARFERIVEEGVLTLGLRTDVPPFAYLRDGKPSGFTAELCARMANAILETSGLEALTARLVSVTAEDRFQRLGDGEFDVLCGATTITLERRETMSFTLPIFATGVGSVVAAEAPEALRGPLIDQGGSGASAGGIARALDGRRLGALAGTTAETWLAEDVMPATEGAEIVAFDDHRAGLSAVAAGEIDAYFADRAILGGVLAGLGERERLVASRMSYTFEPYGLALPRGEEDLRLVLDRALAHLYRTGEILQIYERHFGPPGPNERIFYSVNALPE
ncbi:MAG: amino acid ABC transporter substrate-binding protein [Pseudomonadota bacterium]